MEKRDLMAGRKISSLLGMPIYALDSGRRLGSVKDVIYDGESGMLHAFTMEEPGIFSPRRLVLMFERAKSIGRDAIMVDNVGTLEDERRVPDVMQLLRRNKTIHGKTVLTESGNNLGSIADILIDEDSGTTISYEVTGGFARDVGSGRNYIAAPQTVHIGDNAVLVPDEAEVTMQRQEPSGIAGAYQSVVTGGKAAVGQVSDYTQEQEVNLSRGRIAGKDVFDKNGVLIVAQGQEITDTVIERALADGKTHEVALAAGIGGVSTGYERAKAQAVGATGEQLRGKVVPRDIVDQRGIVVIHRGTIVTDETIARAQEYGVLGQLSSAVLGEQARTGAGSFWQKASQSWNNLTEKTRESADKAGERRVINSQKTFLKGKVSSTDVRDDQGNLILREGEVITPMALETLDRDDKLFLVKLMPEGQPAVGSVETETPTIHFVVETPEQHAHHEQHKEHRQAI